jgi:hypothetical protein
MGVAYVSVRTTNPTDRGEEMNRVTVLSLAALPATFAAGYALGRLMGPSWTEHSEVLAEQGRLTVLLADANEKLRERR